MTANSVVGALVISKTYRELAPMMRRQALRIVRSQADAEDVVHDAFLEALRRADEYDAERGGMEVWIKCIARSRSLDRNRRTAVRRRHTENLFPEFENGPESEQRAMAMQKAEALQRALASLPVEQRNVVEQVYFLGLSAAEIAGLSNSAVGTVKTRIRLAMKKLFRDLQAVADDSGP